jgi:hypothetical protein
MKTSEFEQVLDRRLALIRNVLSSKAKEYSDSSDRLHNFARAGEMLRIGKAEALLGMWAKHVVSIMDLAQTEPSKRQIATTELIEEKIGDAINYLILLEAMLKEEQQSVSILKSDDDGTKKEKFVVPEDCVFYHSCPRRMECKPTIYTCFNDRNKPVQHHPV